MTAESKFWRRSSTEYHLTFLTTIWSFFMAWNEWQQPPVTRLPASNQTFPCFLKRTSGNWVTDWIFCLGEERIHEQIVCAASSGCVQNKTTKHISRCVWRLFTSCQQVKSASINSWHLFFSISQFYPVFHECLKRRRRCSCPRQQVVRYCVCSTELLVAWF